MLFRSVFMLLGCLSIQAADGDLITKQITVKLDMAGTLPRKIASYGAYKITNLRIIGEINGMDWQLIRVMAGRDYDGNATKGNLSVLDLSESKIVDGDRYCYYYFFGFFEQHFKVLPLDGASILKLVNHYMVELSANLFKDEWRIAILYQ